jgi:hypothetical protein
MSRFKLPATALLIRIAVLALGLSLFFEQAGARVLLHLDEGGGQMMMTAVYWVSLIAPVFFLAALWPRRTRSCAWIAVTRSAPQWSGRSSKWAGV